MKPYTLDDAEADLRAAIDADDREAIARLEKVIDDLDAHPPPVSLHSAALWYAEQGLRVFPLQPGRKGPMAKCDRCKARDCPGPQECGHDLCHGLKDADTDHERINRWWTDTPQANIGIATGGLFDVIDIDGPTGVKSWIDLKDDLPTILGKVSTPRPGGSHLYIQADPSRGNKAGLFPGVDYRAAGGYVVCPPSVILPGTKDHPGSYSWYQPLDASALGIAGAA